MMTYDPLGRYHWIGNGGPVSWMQYDGGTIIEETNGAVLRRYVPGPGTDEPLVWYEGATLSDRRWLHADERGSIVAVSNNAGGVIAINRYDEYGIPAATNIGRFQYTGQAWLPEIGAYYYKARIYSPTLGRFMQTDPIGYADGINWYDCVGGDPVNFSDPYGLDSDPPCLGEAMEECAPDEIVVNGDRNRQSLTYLPIVIDFDLRDIVVNAPSFKEAVLSVLCDLPAVSPGVGADLYAVAGGSLGGGLNIDVARGQFGLAGSLAVGLGVGVAVGPGVTAGPSGSSVVSLNLAVGGGFAVPVAPGVNVGLSGGYNVVGTDPGFSGGTIGRFGTPLAYVNGGANFGFNTPPLYDLGCNVT
jgi:RHS repeat-associated protein